MAFLAQLGAGAKPALRSVETVDKSKPVVAAASDGSTAAALLRSKVREVDIDAWHATLAHLSPRTIMLPMSVDEGKLLQAVFVARVRGGAPLDAAQSAALGVLEARLSEAMATFGPLSFVKLSSRSAKDSSLATEALVTQAAALLRSRAWLDELGFAASEEPTGNELVAALLQASIECMGVRTGAAALDLLCASERIYEDIQLELDAPGGGSFAMSFVVREFVPMRAHLEFRGFVHRGELTAVSQYNHICFYPNLVAAAESLEARIRSYFATAVAPLSAALPDSYVIDFAVLHAALEAGSTTLADSAELIVIELNPYKSYEGNGTDACLFDWDRDRAVIERAGGWTIRFRTAPIDGLETVVNREAKAMIERIRARFRATSP